MKLKNKLFIIFIITLLVWFLRIINVLQYDNKLAYPIVLVTMIALFSYIIILHQGFVYLCFLSLQATLLLKKKKIKVII